MRDMFINYDNDCNKKIKPHQPITPFDKPKILESTDDISIAYDKNGNEIGIKVKHNTAFTLFLYLDGWNEEEIDEVVLGSTIVLKVFDLVPKLVFSKAIPAEEIYDVESNYLMIPISYDEAHMLDIDSYRINISLNWGQFSYELYTESNGLLIVR